MIDKRLYRDVSDLLELNVSDDKIIRIMMVRGFTTEQVRRIIKEIRTKGAPMEQPKEKSRPVAEHVVTTPSKRFGGLAKIFGRSPTDDEIIAEEAAKLVEHERLLKEEEVRVHAQVQALVEKAEQLNAEKKRQPKSGIPEDVKDVLQMVDDLLEKLPEEEIRRFSQSPQFEKYKAVMKKYVG